MSDPDPNNPATAGFQSALKAVRSPAGLIAILAYWICMIVGAPFGLRPYAAAIVMAALGASLGAKLRLSVKALYILRGALIIATLAVLLFSAYTVFGEGMSSFYAKGSYDAARHEFFTQCVTWSFCVLCSLFVEIAAAGVIGQCNRNHKR